MKRISMTSQRQQQQQPHIPSWREAIADSLRGRKQRLYFFAGRVTRVDAIVMLGDCLLLAFFKSYRSSQNFRAAIIPRWKACIKFDQTWVGLHFGRFYHKLIRSSCSQGFITTGQLREIISELDKRLTEEDLDGIIEEIDEDGSGTMDFDEFCQVSILRSSILSENFSDKLILPMDKFPPKNNMWVNRHFFFSKNATTLYPGGIRSHDP
jgi:hypothetical protein